MEAQELIDAIVADPDDLASWLVYADWLADRGDVRGELMQLSLAIEAGATAPELAARVRELEADEEVLLSPALAAHAHYWRFTFWRGFIGAAELLGPDDDPPTAASYHALAADPHAALLAKLSLSGRPAVTAAVFGAPPPSLRTLEMASDYRRIQPHAAEPTTAPPMLVHDELRSLAGSSHDAPTMCAGAFELPALESLTWMIVDNDPIFGAASILHRPPPKLHALEVSVTAFRDRGALRRLLVTPLVAQLRSLRLVYVNEDHVATLVAHADALRHLQHLRLDRAINESRAALDAAVPHLAIEWNEPLLRTTTAAAGGRIDAIGRFASRR